MLLLRGVVINVIYERCAGLDVHKKTVVACILTPNGPETHPFGTMTTELLSLADWLLACGCTHVAMESTGDHREPVFNILEGTCEVLLVNAQHVKAVPGPKTDVKDAAWLAELAKGRLRRKRESLAKALDGRVKPHHRFVLTQQLGQIDSLDDTIARFDVQIQEICGPFDEAVGLLDTIPGVARHTADMIVAEIGTDMTRFPSADHLASWAGVVPGNYGSACKRTSGKTHKGHRFLWTTLVQTAHVAARTKGTYLNA
jgi:transposase